jgi:hypothetical protein
MSLRANSDLAVIELEGKEDQILRYYNCNDDNREKVSSYISPSSRVIFPICGKCCFNKVTALRNLNEDNVIEEQRNAIFNWDKDGSDVEKSSIELLIDWLTTEENVSKYFGSCDKYGRTQSERRESYHIRIKDLIKKENG